MAEVCLKNVTKRFDDIVAVQDLDLTVNDGEFVVLLGPTGAGKTTTLRLVAGLEMADSGSIVIEGEEVTTLEPAARDVAFVFQQYSLYPHLTVFENLAFPLKSPARRLEPDVIANRVGEIAEMLHISSKLDNKSTHLSGGEMQRVAIGRALVRDPQIYLMDEPLSSLDAKLRAELRIELKRIQRELGATLLYVTHDQVEAMTMADRVGVISEGRLIQIGSPREIYQDPDSSYVASRLGQPAINLIPANLIEDPKVPPGAVTTGVRTENIDISLSTNGDASGRVDWIEHLGDENHMHVSVGDYKLVTLARADSPLQVGDSVSLTLRNSLYFDHNGTRIRT